MGCTHTSRVHLAWAESLAHRHLHHLCPCRSFWLVDRAATRQAGPVPQQLRDQDLRRTDSDAQDEGTSGTDRGGDIWGLSF